MAKRIGFNDPGAVSLRIGGYQIDGFGRGEFLVVKYNVDRYNLMVGANGDATRSRMYDNSAKIHVKMLSSSPQNAIFHAIMAAEDQAFVEAKGILGGLPVTINDFLNKKTYVADLAWINRAPDDPIGSVDSVEREWVLETNDLSSKYAPVVIPGISQAGGPALVAEVIAQMIRRF